MVVSGTAHDRAVIHESPRHLTGAGRALTGAGSAEPPE